jgi:uncharacterized protein (TIGR02453 family)
MAQEAHFGPGLFRFLSDLQKNNRREWFQENKARYEELIRGPAQRFIVDFGHHLRKISPHFVADPRPVGGSLFRIYRDTRFSKDKSPYKTHTGIHFSHEDCKGAHAPSYYLHLEPRSIFVGVGVWHPDSSTLKRIRDAIVADPKRWKRARDDKRFRALFQISGDSLRRPPRGYDAEHPFVEDLKRKDFVAIAPMTRKDVTAVDFLNRFATTCRAATPFVRWLCEATGMAF